MQKSSGFYVEGKKSQKVLKEEKRRAKEEELMAQIRADLEKEKEIAEKKKADEARVKKEKYEEARKQNSAKFGSFFGVSSARDIVARADFSQPDYVETITSETGTVTRRAFVHYTSHDREDFDGTEDIDCWVGANAHPDPSTVVGWKAGNSYILQYEGFKEQTSPENVVIISKLPENMGVKPAVLW